MYDFAVLFESGTGNTADEKVKNDLKNKVKVWLEDEEQFVGMYLCQGRLTDEVLEKYKYTQTSHIDFSYEH